MNNEIKEILDKLNKLEYDDIHLIICEVISRREIKTLLDYITNLQEENERLNKIMNRIKICLSNYTSEYYTNEDEPRKVRMINAERLENILNGGDE